MLNVLITGAASGIGDAVKEYFINNNHQVYAIDVSKINESDNLDTYQCDITNQTELLKIKSELENKQIKLDAIINIAGIHMMMSLVENDYVKMKRLIDINLCGTMLINNTFHSLLKAEGRIIIVSSEVAGLDPMPFNGLYNVSKTALDSYAQALRQELNLINQKVITIKPGAIATPLCYSSVDATNELAKNTKLYQKQAKHFSNIMLKFMGRPIKPEKIAKIIFSATTKKRPKLVYKKHHNLGLILLNVLPKRLQCKIIKLLLNRK